MIALHDLRLSIRGRTILSQVDLIVEKGEHLLLTGPSGSGKSMLLRMIAGLDAPDAGKVVLQGSTVTSGMNLLVPAHRRGLSMVFQDLGLWPNLSVVGNVLLGLYGETGSRAEKRMRAMECLETVGLVNAAKRSPATLSGGEQQRVALARAFATRPTILLLDEPFAALDVVTRNEVFELIRQKCSKEFITTITVSHQPSDAISLAVNRIAVLENGQVSEIVTREDLISGIGKSTTLNLWQLGREPTLGC